MELVKYTDYEGLKYALQKLLEGIAKEYLTADDAQLLLYTNDNMSEVKNVKDGLDTLTVSVVRLISENSTLNQSINGLKEADENILQQAKDYAHNIIGGQAKLEFKIVDTLPSSNIKENVIYLVPSYDMTDGEHYDEYMYVDGEWEHIGTTKTNLDDYYTKAEVDILIDSVRTDMGTKVDKEIGKSLIDDAELERLRGLETYDDTEIKGMIKDKADNLFKTDIMTVTSLGGIPANSDLNNLSIQEVLTRLLYPYIQPTVSSSILYTPTGGVYEFGQPVVVTGIRTNIVKKSEEIIAVKQYVNGALYETITLNVTTGGTFTTTFSEPIYITKPIANNYFYTQVDDKSGKSTYANTTALNFCYPYYYGVVDPDVAITSTLVKSLNKQVSAKGNKTYTYSPSYQRMLIAYPKAYGGLKSILDPNGFEQLASFEIYEIDIIGLDGTNQTYYVYVNGASSNTDFKMKFNY
jgi:hypothetical protein